MPALNPDREQRVLRRWFSANPGFCISIAALSFSIADAIHGQSPESNAPRTKMVEVFARSAPLDALAFVTKHEGAARVAVVDGKRCRFIGPELEGRSSVCWSPDGSMLAVPVIPQNGESEFRILNWEEKELRRWKTSYVSCYPDWSPDGKIIAYVFADSRPGSAQQIRLVDVDGKRDRLLAVSPPNPGWARWSPDGSRLAFWESNGVSVANKDGSNRQIVTNVRVSAAPAWSSDGKHIAFSSNRDANPDSLAFMQIYTMDKDGADVRRLTDLKGQCSAPTWSPDGRWIAFHMSPSDKGRKDFGPPQLYLVGADGRRLTQLSEEGSDDCFPVWRPRQAPLK